MEKTLVLCFIHGFKGNDDTFGPFPEYFGGLLQRSLAKVAVKVIVYPKYETRGDLQSCVARFREWLQNQVIDIEVSNATPSPMVDPSVRVVLIGHSMGGIVAAETILSIVDEKPISTAAIDKSYDEDGCFMFPSIVGVLAFDTPYLGINPGVFAHGAETQWNNTSSAFTAAASFASALGYGTSAANDNKAESAPPPDKMLPSASSTAEVNRDPAAAPSSSRNWTNIAMITGAVGMLGGGTVAAYLKRNELAESMSWITSHLEFVGCLSRAAELETRLSKIEKLAHDGVIGFADVYTALGKAAVRQTKDNKNNLSAKALGNDRTFCVLPKGETKRRFVRAINDKATSEVEAHMDMFTPRDHPLYHTMAANARDLIVEWTGESAWYVTAEREVPPEEEMEWRKMRRRERDEHGEDCDCEMPHAEDEIPDDEVD